MTAPIKHTIQTLALLVQGMDDKLTHLDTKVDKLRTDQTVAKLQVKVDLLVWVAGVALAASIGQMVYIFFRIASHTI